MDSILIEAARRWICTGSPMQWPCVNLREPVCAAPFFAGVPFRGPADRVLCLSWACRIAPVSGSRSRASSWPRRGGTAFARWYALWCRAVCGDRHRHCGAQPACGHGGRWGRPTRPRTTMRGRRAGQFHQAEWPKRDQWVFLRPAAIVKAGCSGGRSGRRCRPGSVITGISGADFWPAWPVGIEKRISLPLRRSIGCGFVSEEHFGPKRLIFSA